MKYALAIATSEHTIVDISNAGLPVIVAAAKESQAELSNLGDTDSVRVDLRELDSEGAPQRSLLTLAGDAETVGIMLKTRVAKLRKASAPVVTEDRAPLDTV